MKRDKNALKRQLKKKVDSSSQDEDDDSSTEEIEKENENLQNQKNHQSLSHWTQIKNLEYDTWILNRDKHSTF